jgi:hypothetical protein
MIGNEIVDKIVNLHNSLATEKTTKSKLTSKKKVLALLQEMETFLNVAFKNAVLNLQQFQSRGLEVAGNSLENMLYKNYEEAVKWAEEALIFEFFEALTVLNTTSHDFWPEVQGSHFMKCVELARSKPLVNIEYISGKINISYNMEEALGGREDYANAVRTTRSAMGISQVEKAGAPSNWVWYKKLYGIARLGTGWQRLNISRKGVRTWVEAPRTVRRSEEFYWKMMQERINAMENKAPYWYLIEFGNNEKLSSDKSGKRSPVVYQGQRFVKKAKLEAEKTIAALLKQKLSELNKESPEQTEAQLKGEIFRLQSIITEVVHLARDIKSSGKTKKPDILSDLINAKLQKVFSDVELTEQQTADFYRILHKRLTQELAAPVPESKRVSFGVVKGKERRVRIRQMLQQIRKMMDTGGKITEVEA